MHTQKFANNTQNIQSIRFRTFEWSKSINYGAIQMTVAYFSLYHVAASLEDDTSTCSTLYHSQIDVEEPEVLNQCDNERLNVISFVR